MKKRLFITMLLVGMVLVMGGCGSAKGGSDSKSDGTVSSSDKLKVVTTMFAPYDFVRQIAGDNVQLTMLLAPGEESHSYDPTPQDIISIQESDLFIYNGGENDTWVDNVLTTLDDDMNVISMTASVDQLYDEELSEGMQAEEDEHEHESAEAGESHDEAEDGENVGGKHAEDEQAEEEEFDEHVWASPANAMSIVRAITDELKRIDAANASVYEDNCVKYIEKLQKIDDEIKDVVANAKRKVILFGDRFPLRYFTEEFGLEYYAAFPGCSADTEADSSTIAFLIDKVKEENIPVIFKIELSNGNIADTISEATGAKVETFYACHNISNDDFDAGVTYADMMQSNVDVLKEALN